MCSWRCLLFSCLALAAGCASPTSALDPDAAGGAETIDATGSDADGTTVEWADAFDASDGEAAQGTCAAQCDCPANTICSIEGTCVGTPSVAACGADGSCPCGFACVQGFCPPFVGSLSECSASCQCGDETCVAGRCVAAESGGAGTCTTNEDCDGCAGTVCLVPGFPAQCALPDRCWQDLHCLQQVGPGTQCVCGDGTVLHESCFSLGSCAAIAGRAVLHEESFTLTPTPSGQCVDAESARLVVSGGGAPASVLVYVEVSGVIPGGSPPIVQLWTPAGELAWLGFIFYQGAARRLIEAELPTIPATVNGAWRLCNFRNTSENAPTVDRWGLYLRP